MKKVISIDGIDLDHPLYISSEFDVDDYIGFRSVAIDGSSVMFIQAKGAMTKEVSIYSKDNGWISETTKALLMASVDNQSIVVEFDDLSNATYYFNHTKVPMEFTPLFEGSLWFTVKINLLKG